MVEPDKVRNLTDPGAEYRGAASRLTFYPDRSHFRSGLLRLKCQSDIIQKYTVGSEEVLIEESVKFQASPTLDIPVISGLKPGGYRVGDIVNLTCVSRAKTAPRLSFLIDDEVRNNIRVLIPLPSP